MKKHFLIFLFLLSTVAHSQYQLNENCKNGWMLLMDLKIDEAKRLMEKEISINPTNYYALYLEQTCDAYALYINPSDKEYDIFLDNYDEKREKMDGKFEDSPYYLMCKSTMDLQLGVIKIMNGSTIWGVSKAFSGYKGVYKNLDKHPNFMPSLMLDGFFNIALSNLPPFLKNTISKFGVSSDLGYGVETLKKVYESQKNIKGVNAESSLFRILVAKINKTSEMVYDFTQSYDDNIQNLFLLKYFKANIEYSIGKNDQSLETLSNLPYNNSSYSRLLYNYMMSKALLRKLDNRSGYHSDQYLKQLYKKQYFKEITYNWALNYLLQDNRVKYKELCSIVIDEGSDINERDREAFYDASLDYEPDINLVKARLLIDGEYLNRFKKVIVTYEDHPRKELPYQLEYYFLKGKYAVATKDDIKAKTFFKWIIENGKNEDYYFACESALKLGNIYEKEGDYDNAKKYYSKSESLYKKRYYEYIGAKADKALTRIKYLWKE